MINKKKVLSFVGKTNANIIFEKPTQISYLLYLAQLLRIDRKGWGEVK